MGDGSAVLDDATSPAWAIVLAGGLIREVFGDERPKQYAPLMGTESLLRQTLQRTERLIPVERTVVVSQERHARWLAGELSAERRPKVLLQPENRDTAAGVLLPVYWAASQDPGVTVVVFPSDHFVLEGAAFLAHVAEVVTFVERNPGWIVLLGARATEPDPAHGWVEPGEAVGSTTAGPITRVARFREKPTPQAAATCLARGWLWNTFVFVARASTLVSVADVLLPELHHRLAAAAPFFGTRREAWAIRRAYVNLPRHNFSEMVAQGSPGSVRASAPQPS